MVEGATPLFEPLVRHEREVRWTCLWPPYPLPQRRVASSTVIPCGKAQTLAHNGRPGARREALFAADEFSAARISSPHTRRADACVVRRILSWCDQERLELRQVSPGLAGRFLDDLPGVSSTKKPGLGCPQAFLRHPQYRREDFRVSLQGKISFSTHPHGGFPTRQTSPLAERKHKYFLA